MCVLILQSMVIGDRGRHSVNVVEHVVEVNINVLVHVTTHPLHMMGNNVYCRMEVVAEGRKIHSQNNATQTCVQVITYFSI